MVMDTSVITDVMLEAYHVRIDVATDVIVLEWWMKLE